MRFGAVGFSARHDSTGKVYSTSLFAGRPERRSHDPPRVSAPADSGQDAYVRVSIWLRGQKTRWDFDALLPVPPSPVRAEGMRLLRTRYRYPDGSFPWHVSKHRSVPRISAPSHRLPQWLRVPPSPAARGDLRQYPSGRSTDLSQCLQAETRWMPLAADSKPPQPLLLPRLRLAEMSGRWLPFCVHQSCCNHTMQYRCSDAMADVTL